MGRRVRVARWLVATASASVLLGGPAVAEDAPPAAPATAVEAVRLAVVQVTSTGPDPAHVVLEAGGTVVWLGAAGDLEVLAGEHGWVPLPCTHPPGGCVTSPAVTARRFPEPGAWSYRFAHPGSPPPPGGTITVLEPGGGPVVDGPDGPEVDGPDDPAPGGGPDPAPEPEPEAVPPPGPVAGPPTASAPEPGAPSPVTGPGGAAPGASPAAPPASRSPSSPAAPEEARSGGTEPAGAVASSGLPPELRAAMAAVTRTGARSTAELLDLLARAGLSGEPAIRLGFGRFPVGGLATYTHDWLLPRFGPGWRLHQGTDVFAPRGTPVRAPADGELRIATNRLGGLTVRVTEPDGTYWYLAHLDAVPDGIADGAEVVVGEVVGFVGTSGNARGTPPHLHVELHPGGGAAVDVKPVLDRFLDEAVAAARAAGAEARPGPLAGRRPAAAGPWTIGPRDTTAGAPLPPRRGAATHEGGPALPASSAAPTAASSLGLLALVLLAGGARAVRQAARRGGPAPSG